MSDLTNALLPALTSHRLPGLDLGDDFVYPKYDGQSILNIPSSVCQLLGIPELESPPLIPEILTPLGKEARRVVFILMDALALHRLRRWIEEGSAPVWKQLAEEGLLAPLTSISPSTTSAAITALWTGAPPAQHGITGYEMWLREYGVIGNMIEHRPITYRSGGDLSLAGFDPETFLPVAPIGPHFKAHGVNIYGFQHYALIGSGLSQMFMADAQAIPFQTPADLWISMRMLLEEKLDEKMYVWAYWGAVDGLSHFKGPDDPRPAAEFFNFSQAFEQYFLNELSAEARKDTVVVLAADHGQITTNNLDPHYQMVNHPNLMRRLHMQPTGENRLAYLYIKPGQTEAVREYVERTWPNQFAIIESAYALEKGLFGPGTPHEMMLDRIGELILAARGDAYLWWATKFNHLIGRHGGLHPEEMLVPFLAARLE